MDNIFPTQSNKTAVSQHMSRSPWYIPASFYRFLPPLSSRTGHVSGGLQCGGAKSIEPSSFGALKRGKSARPISPSPRHRQPNPPAHVCPGVGGFRRHSGCSQRPGRRGGRLVARPALEMTTRLNSQVLLHKIELDRLKDLRRKPPRRQATGGIRVTFNGSRDTRGSGISCRCLSCPSGVFSAKTKSAEVTAGVRLRVCVRQHLRSSSARPSRAGFAAQLRSRFHRCPKAAASGLFGPSAPEDAFWAAPSSNVDFSTCGQGCKNTLAAC